MGVTREEVIAAGFNPLTVTYQQLITIQTNRGSVVNKPTLGRFVHYRGKHGLQVMRPALVVCAKDDLDPRGVESGEIQDLDSDLHVHLIVFTPSTQLGFFEQNIPHGVPGDDGLIPPGTWMWPVIK